MKKYKAIWSCSYGTLSFDLETDNKDEIEQCVCDLVGQLKSKDGDTYIEEIE